MSNFRFEQEAENGLSYNIFWDTVEDLGGIFDSIDFDHGDRYLRFGTPQQFTYNLLDVIEHYLPGLEHNKRLDILRNFAKDEIELYEKEGRDKYLEIRGIMPLNALDEYFRTNEIPEGQSLADGIRRAFIKNANELVVADKLAKQAAERQSQRDRNLERSERLAQDANIAKKLFQKALEAVQRAAEGIAPQGDRLRQRREKASTLRRALVSKISKRLKRADRKIGSKAARTRFRNQIESDEGHQVLGDFITAASKISLATRKQMGVRAASVPSKGDLKIAERLAGELIESGSLSKSNIVKHLWRARHYAADYTIKNSRSRSVLRRKPSFANVRKRLLTMNVDFDQLATSIKQEVNQDRIREQAMTARERRRRDRQQGRDNDEPSGPGR